METERVVAGHRRALHPTAEQAEVLEAQAAYAERVRRWAEGQDSAAP